ncbi:MAG: hypothetical protein ACK2U9_19825, partial [Anaerolineae bacterium]
RFMRAKGLHLIVSGAPKEVYRVLKKSGVLLTLQEGCDRRAGAWRLVSEGASMPDENPGERLCSHYTLQGCGCQSPRRFFRRKPPSHQATKNSSRV